MSIMIKELSREDNMAQVLDFEEIQRHYDGVSLIQRSI